MGKKKLKECICLIPARSGSKRLKNKNIKLVNNHPLIEIVIKIAKKSKLFSDIFVSTDSKKIKKIAESNGAKVPYLRSKRISNDKSGTDQVILDFIKKTKIKKDFLFCIYPTAILISPNDLIDAYKVLKKRDADCLVSMGEFNSSPYRSLKIIKNGYIKFWKEKYSNQNSQELEKLYFDAGAFYIYKTKFLKKNKLKMVFPNKTIPYILNHKKSIDINTNDDFKFAKSIFLNKNYK